jgi:hypothetical protein
MPITSRAAGIAIAGAAAAAITPSPALARNAVFGGSTSKGAPIVITADKKAKTLRSAVVSWRAVCDDGRGFPIGVPLEPVAADPGFSPGFRELATSRNGKGRFAGTRLFGFDIGDQTAAVQVDIAGRLRARRATGTLTVSATFVDEATGATVSTCETGRVKWSADRDPGRVYGGKTSQDEPVVVRLNRQRKRVTDLLYGWQSAGCQPPGFVRFSERLTNFRISRRGAFGDTFEQSFGGGDNPKLTLTYTVDGTIARKASRGTLRVQTEQRDATTGTVTQTCDSGTVCWRATTG